MKLIRNILGAVFALVIGLMFLGALTGPDKKPAEVAKATTVTQTSTTVTPTPMSDEERTARIAALEQKVRPIPASDYDGNLAIYRELLSLDPQNPRYKEKVSLYRMKKNEAQDMMRNPVRYVKIVDFSWSMEGFGSVMEATFVIKNSLPINVKDIEVKCTHSAASGTVIDSNTRTIYEVIRSGKTRTFREFNMGFIHSQAKRSSCVIVDVATFR